MFRIDPATFHAALAWHLRCLGIPLEVWPDEGELTRAVVAHPEVLAIMRAHPDPLTAVAQPSLSWPYSLISDLTPRGFAIVATDTYPPTDRDIYWRVQTIARTWALHASTEDDHLVREMVDSLAESWQGNDPAEWKHLGDFPTVYATGDEDTVLAIIALWHVVFNAMGTQMESVGFQKLKALTVPDDAPAPEAKTISAPTTRSIALVDATGNTYTIHPTRYATRHAHTLASVIRSEVFTAKDSDLWSAVTARIRRDFELRRCTEEDVRDCALCLTITPNGASLSGIHVTLHGTVHTPLDVTRMEGLYCSGWRYDADDLPCIFPTGIWARYSQFGTSRDDIARLAGVLCETSCAFQRL